MSGTSAVAEPVHADEKTSVVPSVSVIPIESLLPPPRSVTVTRSVRLLPSTVFLPDVSVSVAVDRRSALCQHVALAGPLHVPPPEAVL